MSERLNVYKAPTEILATYSSDGFKAKIARSRSSGEIHYEHCEDVHRMFITMAGKTRSTIARCETLPEVRRPDRPGAVTVVPAGMRRHVLLEEFDFVIMKVGISDSFLAQCMEDEGVGSRAGLTAPTLRQNVDSPWLLRAACAFRDAACSGALEMQLQTLAFAMVKHLARSQQRVRAGGGLDPYALSRVLQLMQDRLADDLTLTELADEAGLGVSAFSRAFAKSIGMSPYRHFADLRMQRAKELLASGELPLAAIAGEVGYADQAHFTAAFTRHTGISPGKWRIEFGSPPSFSPISRKTEARIGT